MPNYYAPKISTESMIRAEAKLSEDRRYRYWLLRVWAPGPVMGSIGVNPSTADETTNDATIRKDIGFARRLGFGGLLKLNVGAFRSTDPRVWRKAWDRIGSENTAKHLVGYAKEFEVRTVVAAWGKHGQFAIGQCEAIRREFVNGLWCFGRNADGSPRHTLMIPYSSELVIFD